MAKPTVDSAPSLDDVRAIPPGDTRRDALRAHNDAVVAAAEANDAEGYVDPSRVRIDREIAVHIVNNRIRVPNADPRFRYCWVRAYDNYNRYVSEAVDTKRSILVDVDGRTLRAWEIVKHGEHRDAEGLDRTPEGYCRIGDTILMRCRDYIYTALERDAVAQRQEFAGSKQREVADRLEHEARGQMSFRTLATSNDIARPASLAG